MAQAQADPTHIASQAQKRFSVMPDHGTYADTAVDIIGPALYPGLQRDVYLRTIEEEEERSAMKVGTPYDPLETIRASVTAIFRTHCVLSDLTPAVAGAPFGHVSGAVCLALPWDARNKCTTHARYVFYVRTGFVQDGDPYFACFVHVESLRIYDEGVAVPPAAAASPDYQAHYDLQRSNLKKFVARCWTEARARATKDFTENVVFGRFKLSRDAQGLPTCAPVIGGLPVLSPDEAGTHFDLAMEHN